MSRARPPAQHREKSSERLKLNSGTENIRLRSKVKSEAQGSGLIITYYFLIELNDLIRILFDLRTVRYIMNNIEERVQSKLKLLQNAEQI